MPLLVRYKPQTLYIIVKVFGFHMFNDFSDGYPTPWAEQGGQPQPPFHIIDEDGAHSEAITTDDPLELADPVTRNKKPALSITEMENTEPSDDQPDYEEDGNASETADIDGDLSYAEASHDPFSMYCAKLQGEKQKFLDRQEVYELSEEGKQHRTDMIEALLSIPYTRRRIIAAFQKTAKITAKLSTHIAVRYTQNRYKYQNKEDDAKIRAQFEDIAVRLSSCSDTKRANNRAFADEIVCYSLRRFFWKKLLTKAQENAATMPAEDQDQLKKAAQAFAEDTRCRNDIALNFQRFTLKIAKSFFHRHVPRMDVFQSGFVGLLDVYDTWDHTLGFGIMSFAAPNIKQSIQLAFARTERLSRMAPSRDRAINALIAFTARFVDEHGRYPTDKETAEGIGHTEATIKAIRPMSCVARLDKNVGDSETPFSAFVPSELAPPDQELERKGIKEVIAEELGKLTPREARLLRLRHFAHGKKGSGLTLKEAGKILDAPFGGTPITRERARQIEAALMKKLKNNQRLLVAHQNG